MNANGGMRQKCTFLLLLIFSIAITVVVFYFLNKGTLLPSQNYTESVRIPHLKSILGRRLESSFDLALHEDNIHNTKEELSEQEFDPHEENIHNTTEDLSQHELDPHEENIHNTKEELSELELDPHEENIHNTKGELSEHELADNWIEVDEDLFVYSSYLDNRQSPKSTVRIIAITCSEILHRQPIICYLSQSKNIDEVDGYVKTIATQELLEKQHSFKCKPNFINCPIPESTRMVEFIALKPFKSKSILRWLKVRNLAVPEEEPTGLAVCVRPMFAKYRDVFRIAEFIGYYEALGATRFTFYDYEADNSALKFIENLRKHDVPVQVLPWSHGKPFLAKTWGFGQMASIQDCIYRNMYRNAYVAIVDLDEFITPRKVMTLVELLNSIDSNLNGGVIAEYVFQSTIFDINSPKDVIPRIPPFVTQTVIHRQDYSYPHRFKSKYVAKPELVVIGGFHFSRELLDGCGTINVPHEDALVNHYRDPTSLIYARTGVSDIIDVTGRKYLRRLLTSRSVSLWNNTLAQQFSEIE